MTAVFIVLTDGQPIKSKKNEEESAGGGGSVDCVLKQLGKIMRRQGTERFGIDGAQHKLIKSLN